VAHTEINNLRYVHYAQMDHFVSHNQLFQFLALQVVTAKVDKIHVKRAMQVIIVYKARQYKFHVQKELTAHQAKVNVQHVKLAIPVLFVQFNRLNVLQELQESLANLYVHFVLLVHSVLKDHCRFVQLNGFITVYYLS